MPEHNTLATTAASLTGTVATARLGTGTADNTTFLRGDQTWATPAGGGSALTVSDEGVDTGDDATTINFVGAGVTASGAGATKTITIPGAGTYDPVTTVQLVDDFMSGTTTAPDIGDLGWSFNGGTLTQLVSEANHPGIINRATGASASVVAYTHPRATPGTGIIDPAMAFDTTLIFRLPAANTIGNDVVRHGLMTTWATSGAADMIVVEKLAADTNWFLVTRTASGAMNRVDTGVAAATNAWIKTRVRRIDASTVGVTVNAASEVTTTISIPTAQLHWGFQIVNTAAATTESMDIDLATLTITGLTR